MNRQYLLKKVIINQIQNTMIQLKHSFLPAIMSLFLFASCASEGSEQQASQEPEKDRAPEFSVTTIDGETISLEESLSNDKPVVVYFTASWCPTCAKNWPVLSKLYPEYKDDLTLVSISIDPTDTEQVMKDLAEKEGITYPTTEGNPDVMLAFGVESQATTVGVNREGFIEFKRSNTALSEQEYRELFDSLVAG